ncbi:MAG TPA: hypothetical protein VN456_00425 [Desulfosporosinus sp.]|nr:hypothetical protein [Desulfosporosinus sp.]
MFRVPVQHHGALPSIGGDLERPVELLSEHFFLAYWLKSENLEINASLYGDTNVDQSSIGVLGTEDKAAM